MSSVRALASSLGVGSVLLLTGCPDDPSPITSESDTSGTSTSTGDVDSTSTATPDPDSDGSTTAPDPDADGSTTEPGPETSGPTDDCGNGVIDGDEVCDGEALDGATCRSEGFDEGTLGCRADCRDYDRNACVSYGCGNGVIDSDEVCDGQDHGGVTCQSMGFETGTPTCSNNCEELDLSGCGTCGNVIVDGDETCDGIVLFGETCESQGYSSGQLACMPDCFDYDYAGCIMCGNDIIDGVEPCDGPDLGGATCVSEGYVGGTLGCNDDCGFDISGCNTCGNLTIEPGESCDGVNLNNATCESLGLVGGTLSCANNCQYDFSACDIPGVPFGNDVGYMGVSLLPPVLPCDNILATGTPTNLSDDDEITVNIGFTFEMYDTPFTQASISSNGVVQFGTPNNFLPLGGTCPPDDTFSLSNDYILGAFWTDLNPGAAGDVYYQTLGPVGDQRFVVQWEVPFFGGDIGDLLRIQAMFRESGVIEVCYVDTISLNNFDNSGADAAAGIQRDAVTGFSHSCSMPVLTNGLQLMYIPL